MTVKRVLLYPVDEAALRQPSVAVDGLGKPIRRLIQDLKDTLATQPGAGLAAPQIGVHRRVVVVRFGQGTEAGMGPPVALVNPAIVEEGPPQRGFDGCLSLPDVATWDALRPLWLRFRAIGEDGQPFERCVEGADAALVHHEVDHLNGVLFLDRLDDTARLYIAVENPDGTERYVPIPRMLGRKPTA